MQSIATLINRTKFAKNESAKPINENYEQAREFGQYVGLNPIFVLKLFKQYGKEKVLSQRGWLKDIPYDPTRGGKTALIVWRLKNI